MGKEKCSCSVEEEGSTEATRRASLFRQRPERGDESWSHYLNFQFFTLNCLVFVLFAHFAWSYFNLLYFDFPLHTFRLNPHLLPYLLTCLLLCFVFVSLPLSYSCSLAACRVFVSGAAAPAVSWLLLALAVLQALSKVGDCGCGMCWWPQTRWNIHPCGLNSLCFCNFQQLSLVWSFRVLMTQIRGFSVK